MDKKINCSYPYNILLKKGEPQLYHMINFKHFIFIRNRSIKNNCPCGYSTVFTGLQRLALLYYTVLSNPKYNAESLC